MLGEEEGRSLARSLSLSAVVVVVIAQMRRRRRRRHGQRHAEIYERRKRARPESFAAVKSRAAHPHACSLTRHVCCPSCRFDA